MTLAEDMDKDPKSLIRLFSAKENQRADNLLAMVARLKQREGVAFSVTQNNELHAYRSFKALCQPTWIHKMNKFIIQNQRINSRNF